MKNTVDFYNKTANEWAESGYNNVPDVPSMFDFAKNYPSGSRFLDLCCGAGYETQRLHNLGYTVVGIDFSEESLKIARKKNPDISFYQENILNDYSYIGKVDAIFIIAGLVHIEKSELKTAFSNMRKVLNDNGQVFITVYEGNGKIPERSIKLIEEEEYDRNFIGHSLEELIVEARGLFDFVNEVGYDGTAWHNYIFKCSAPDSSL
ncbi:MAG: class I SAM-dependent methyltransferase [Clostridia bacterium]|nr:class I SAM-dependent methyltransferase [Clostridia bacterium]MBO5256961.1 class I SAM-dependent methyltransferase [Clostridia bacterium]MBP3293643.1 class I SAM-dependent methyltransferase [Clostridia bacterium]